MDFLTELKNRAALVDRALAQYMPPADAYPPLIHRAMRYSLFAGGKRLRPVLALAAAEAAGRNPEPVMPAACALELIHTYSLVHDDLPAMDNDDLRRGKPTNHRVFGEAAAILAGDALLTLAFGWLAGCAGSLPAERVARVIAEVAEAAGSAGLIGGQAVDTLSSSAEMDEKTLEYIHRHKTGALFRAAVRTGAILSGADEARLASLTAYAENLGLAFQITDDILDESGDPARMGKTAGSDQKNKKATYPALFGLERAAEKARRAADASVAALENFGAEAAFLRQLAQFVTGRDH
ncbi:polyprenyl synthetase family protein [Desulfotomaculum copahuensis]|uniref:Farnesyl diphosphate synthase n=1 Tax=Desulfotomaculum copahuensis TaxID=1838280 RepID=A0A1B7LIW6_9FIRM|nr:farnesyl diphosphate synthase [Desulfotomaculum copahuensis]OAT86519.1 geranyl transferase [Desulfotomaculum copahuensis]